MATRTAIAMFVTITTMAITLIQDGRTAVMGMGVTDIAVTTKAMTRKAAESISAPN